VGYRTFVKFDPYELAMLRKLQEELAAKNGGKKPTMTSLIQGCVRTAIHSVYGENFAYDKLLSKGQFEELMAKVGSETQG
jgi:hypothetical protein